MRAGSAISSRASGAAPVPAEATRAPTIVDVAHAADVAIGTVSRYLNGHSVRRHNRDRIEEAIGLLAYKRNAVAVAMKTDVTRMIGFLVPSFDEFHGNLLEHLSREVRRQGRALTIYCHDGDPRTMTEGLDFFAAQRIDALITSGAEAVNQQVEAMIRGGLPVLLYNDDNRGLRADRIFVENQRASRRVVGHLIDIGHRRIAILRGRTDSSSAEERFHGYVEALADGDLPLDPRYVINGGWTEHGGAQGVKRLMALDRPPTAIFASNYPMTIGALGWLKDNGLTVPDTVSLVAFDDVPLFRLHEPGITAIAQPIERMAGVIAESLSERLTPPGDAAERTITLDCDIILRGSTRPPR